VCEDNPDPQFPHTILFLTVTQNPGDEIDQYWLGKVLRDHWSDEEDVIGPLLSRIGNYVTTIKLPEKPTSYFYYFIKLCIYYFYSFCEFFYII